MRQQAQRDIKEKRNSLREKMDLAGVKGTSKHCFHLCIHTLLQGTRKGQIIKQVKLVPATYIPSKAMCPGISIETEVDLGPLLFASAVRWM